jgi:hypothetical protein
MATKDVVADTKEFLSFAEVTLPLRDFISFFSQLRNCLQRMEIDSIDLFELPMQYSSIVVSYSSGIGRKKVIKNKFLWFLDRRCAWHDAW